MMARWFLMMLGVMVSLSFAARYTRYNIVLSDSSVGYSQSQTVAQKLQTAPIAYYGSLIQRTYLQKDFYNAENAEFEQRYPRVYESFVGWANYKQKRQDNLLTQAPEQYQKMFEQRYALMNIKGFFLIHDEIRVDKVYDKVTKTWVTPKPGEEKKELFISKVDHAAVVEIDEQGVSGAAYVDMAICGSGMPNENLEITLDVGFGVTDELKETITIRRGDLYALFESRTED